MTVEVNGKFVDKNYVLVSDSVKFMITPPIDKEYWMLRVKLSDSQAIVAFPKFATVGIGFQQEVDWNTNLPYTCSAETIFNHIEHNKGDNSISDADCIAAIVEIQKAIAWIKIA